jgi:hypothetical protein
MAAVPETSKRFEILSPSTIPTATGVREMPCTDEGWPRAARIAGIVLQHSIP